jgi:hypothetical protein
MTKHRQILNFIASIRDAHPDMVKIYTKGSCMNFFQTLRSIYPEAQVWYNGDHAITKIDKHFYDITGHVSSKGYLPYHTYYNKRRLFRKLIQMLNNS